MRHYMNLFENRARDDRDMEQKLRDLIDHPTTEPFIRSVAQRQLDKLLAAQEEEIRRNTPTPNVPATNILILAGYGQTNPPELPREKWGDVYLHGNGRRLTYQTVLERVLPLRPFKIVFDQTMRGLIGPHVDLWFHPEDEPDNGQAIQRAVNTPNNIWGKVIDGDASKYLRGGQSMYHIWFGQYAKQSKRK